MKSAPYTSLVAQVVHNMLFLNVLVVVEEMLSLILIQILNRAGKLAIIGLVEYHLLLLYGEMMGVEATSSTKTERLNGVNRYKNSFIDLCTLCVIVHVTK